MQHSLRSLSLLVLLFTPALCFAIEWRDCRIGPNNSPRTVQASCAHLSVPENRADEKSRVIDLNIAMVWSWSKHPKKDPVLYLAGGPGQSAVDSYVQIEPGFQQLIKERNILLVDQRGTGKSKPLNCAIDKSTLFSTPTQAESKRFFQACLDKLNADTRYYTTTESILDLEDVRKALEIERWNLIGVSYGTRKALTYAKMFPSAIRSMTLDGVVPQQEALGVKHEANLRSALEKQFDVCQQQAPCAKAFGDVTKTLESLLQKADQAPVTLTIPDPLSGDKVTITVTREVLTSVVRMFSYTADNFRLLPLLLDMANKGNYESLAAQALLIEKSLEENMALGMDMSVICAEDAPFYPEAIDTEPFFSTTSMLTTRKEQCAYWPHALAKPSFKEPVSSDIPTLLLSGELDPVTPPTFAEAAANTLSKSKHLIASGLGHGVFMRGCMPFVIRDFIDEPFLPLDTHCMDSFAAPDFFINLMGPAQ